MSQNKLQNKGNKLNKPVLHGEQHGMTLKKERDQLVRGEVGPHPDSNPMGWMAGWVELVGGVFMKQKSSNRIELSRLGGDLFDY